MKKNISTTSGDLLVDATPEESQSRIFGRVLKLERDRQYLYVRSLQSLRMSRDDMFHSLVNNQIIRDLGRRLESSMNAQLDDERISKRR